MEKSFWYPITIPASCHFQRPALFERVLLLLSLLIDTTSYSERKKRVRRKSLFSIINSILSSAISSFFYIKIKNSCIELTYIAIQVQNSTIIEMLLKKQFFRNSNIPSFVLWQYFWSDFRRLPERMQNVRIANCKNKKKLNTIY